MALIRMGLRDPIEHELRLIQSETLVVRKSHDAIAPQRWADGTVREKLQRRGVELLRSIVLRDVTGAGQEE
jgi:hypothetical protein